MGLHNKSYNVFRVHIARNKESHCKEDGKWNGHCDYLRLMGSAM